MDAIKGNTAMPHIQTAGQLIPCVVMSTHAVVAIRPPTVLLALQRLRSPLVLNASVRSTLPSSLVICPSNGLGFLPVIVYMYEILANADAVKARRQQPSNDKKAVA